MRFFFTPPFSFKEKYFLCTIIALCCTACSSAVEIAQGAPKKEKPAPQAPAAPKQDGNSTPIATPTQGSPESGESNSSNSSSNGAIIPPSPSPSGRWVMGYYVGYQSDPAKPGNSQQSPNEINFSYLTHIAIGVALAQSDGSLNLRFYKNSEAEGKAWAKATIDAAHRANRKALLMLGGEGNGRAILNAMQNAPNTLVNNLVRAVKELQFDGIDLDWEDDINPDLFIQLARMLRERLPQSILTVPGGMINANYQRAEPWLAELAQYLDQYNIMSYAPATTNIGNGWYSWHTSPLAGEKPNTPVSISDTLRRLSAIGIPQHKLGMGVGFYAVCYGGNVTGPNQPTEYGQTTLKGGDNIFPLWKLFNAEGQKLMAYRKWDTSARVPYLTLPTPLNWRGMEGCRYVTYEDPESLKEKGRFARENGYGGLIIWTISQGHIAENAPANRDPLLKAAYEGFILNR